MRIVKIGAYKTAKICKKALAVFDGKVPADREAREELLDNLDCDEIFEKLDDSFYDYEDDLQALNEEYILKNKSYFE